MKSYRRLAPVWLLVAMLVITACGGTTSNSDSPGSSASSSSGSSSDSASGSASYQPSVERPNILVFETDDMRADDLRYMPATQRLIGGQGLTYQNSFAPNPLCCPSRASFLTGKYSHNHHVLSHVNPYGFGSFDDSTTIATELTEAGYSTALVGKYLNGYGKQPTFKTKKSSVNYVPPGWTTWMAGSDHEFGPGSPNFGSTYNYFHMTQNINGKIVPHPGVYSTNLMGRQVRGILDDFTAKQDPFFIWWTPVAPHMGAPREPDDPPARIFNGDKARKFATPARPDWVKGRFDSQITHPQGMPAFGPAEADVSDKPDYLNDLPEASPAERNALTEVTRQRAESLYVLDREVAKTIRHLKKIGAYDHTILVFTSDNGYFLGEHRKRTGKIVPHEPSLRVPFLISGPGIPRGVRYDPITTIDLAPTFASYAGIRGGMPEADGFSMVRNIERGDTGWNVPVLTEGRMGDYPRKQKLKGFGGGLNARGIRTAQFKYVRYSTGEEELYDFRNDPLELQSRQDDPKYATVKQRMRKLWDSYYDCAQQTCRVPLSKSMRTSADQTKSITDKQTRQTNEYYDLGATDSGLD